MRESHKTECNSCNCCSCSNAVAVVTLILTACTLIGGAILGTCMYKKVSTLHKMWIEAEYGSAANFENIFNTVMTDDYRAQLDENVANQIEQIKQNQANSNSEDADVSGEDSETSAMELVNPTATSFEDNADEAYSLFAISGTPGNVIISKSNLMYKVIGGAYPQEYFKEAIAAVQEGTAENNDIGQAGYLTQEQLDTILADVYYYQDNANADIIILEYSDLLCPYCKRHYEARTIEELVEDDSSLALVFKNMPLSFHETADFGAKGVECAGQLGGSEAYYNFITEAFALEDGRFTTDNLTTIAEKLGLDTETFGSCLNA